MKRLKDLRQKKGELATEMRAMLDKADTEKRSLSSDEETAYRQIEERYDAVAKDVEREERQLERERDRAAQGLATDRTDPAAPADGQVEVRALDRLAELRRNRTPELEARAQLSEPERAAVQTLERRALSTAFAHGLPACSPIERRALQADSDIAGGYLRPPITWIQDMIQAVDDQVFVRRFATKHSVTDADGLGAPSLDADVADADWTSEVAAVAEDTALKFGRRELHPHPLSKLVKVSMKLLRKTAGGAESLVRTRLGYKFGVTEEKGFLTGTGASQALGVFTASADGISTGRDVQTGSATSITADALIDAKYKLKGNYWAKARWLFHRDGLKIIRKLKDTTNQYLWQPGLVAGQPDRILDVPVDMSEFCPNTFTTGKYVGLIGDWTFYWIADALAFEVQRLNELYAATNQIGFIGRQEIDGMPVLEEAFARLITN